jgi:5-methylcytosine-specific restriction endonuclease McrA
MIGMNSKTKRTQGSKWIRREKRLAIYLRDGLACCYCGATLEDGAELSLDHIRPYSKGGSNEASNLVTCCKRCNSARGNRPLRVFARAVAEYTQTTTADAIVRHADNCRRRQLDVAGAKTIMSRRGSWTAALAN